MVLVPEEEDLVTKINRKKFHINLTTTCTAVNRPSLCKPEQVNLYRKSFIELAPFLGFFDWKLF